MQHSFAASVGQSIGHFLKDDEQHEKPGMFAGNPAAIRDQVALSTAPDGVVARRLRDAEKFDTFEGDDDFGL